MKRNGFTLIELIGTVVILAIIALVVFPATLSILNQGQEEVDKSVKDAVKGAANKYVQENLNDFPKQLESKDTIKSYGDKGTITTKELVDKGYLDNSIYEKHCHIKNDQVIVTSNSKKYFYEYKEIDDNEEC